MEHVILIFVFLILVINLAYEMFLAPGPLENLPEPFSDKKEEDSSKEE